MVDNSIVPFGKYKGRPVDQMLADGGYMQWLEGQPWFRERFGHLVAARAAERDAVECTPVHNRLQSLFLDTSYRIAFLKAAGIDFENLIKVTKRHYMEKAADLRKEAETHKEEMSFCEKRDVDWRIHRYEFAEASRTKCISRAEKYEQHVPLLRVDVNFEENGADVLITLYVSHVPQQFEWGTREWITDGEKYLIEIKPSVSDDYPVVLRQMKRHKSNYLFVDEYVGEGATRAQFVQIFAASSIKVVFKGDVDAFVE